MVGAAILICIAVVTGGMGLVVWIGANGDPQAQRGLTLLMIAATTLSAGLIIDGIRFYAEKISTQLAWASKRANYFNEPSALSDQSASSDFSKTSTPKSPPKSVPKRAATPMSNTKKLIRYQVVGIDQETKRETELVVQAMDKTAALRIGEKAGLSVTRVEQADA